MGNKISDAIRFFEDVCEINEIRINGIEYIRKFGEDLICINVQISISTVVNGIENQKTIDKNSDGTNRLFTNENLNIGTTNVSMGVRGNLG
jgi:uncharacterized protein YsxB (DUF464 family)